MIDYRKRQFIECHSFTIRELSVARRAALDILSEIPQSTVDQWLKTKGSGIQDSFPDHNSTFWGDLIRVIGDFVFGGGGGTEPEPGGGTTGGGTGGEDPDPVGGTGGDTGDDDTTGGG